MLSSKENFKSLATSLEFKNDFSVYSPMIVRHLETTRDMLSLFLETSPLITSEFRDEISKLSQERILRLISSPYLCELLMIYDDQINNNSSVIKKQIVMALVAEMKLDNPNFQFTMNPKWTIDGDIVLDKQIASVVPAVKTTCGININYQSYIHNTGKPGIGGYDYPTALKHKERIETAKKIIAEASASSLSLIETFTTTIQFRQNTVKPNVINSSTHTSIGLIRCDNFHKIHSDLPEIVDMLVHESIHQYLHLFEEQISSFTEMEQLPTSLLDARLFPSPWSGNLLDIKSYTHAILVWYGLIHFWDQFLNKKISHPEISHSQALEKLNEALYGFINTDSVLDNLGENKKYLSTEYISEIQTIQHKIKSMIGFKNAAHVLRVLE